MSRQLPVISCHRNITRSGYCSDQRLPHSGAVFYSSPPACGGFNRIHVYNYPKIQISKYSFFCAFCHFSLVVSLFRHYNATYSCFFEEIRACLRFVFSSSSVSEKFLTCRLYTIMHYVAISNTLYTFRTNQNYDPVCSTRHIL